MTQQDASREGFEKWAMTEGWNTERDKRTGNYLAAHTHYGWQAWNAKSQPIDWRSTKEALAETLTPFMRYNEEDAPEAADACVAVLKAKMGV